jgi:hypothetical protein
VKCPKCGAENPENAENCNLCWHSFIDKRPADNEPERQPAVLADKEDLINPDVRKMALKGGIAAILGAWLFLASLTIIHIIGVRVFDFLFTNLGINRPNLSFFIMAIGLFALLSGGIGGNLDDKRDIVPAVRTVAALAGLGIWVGIVFALKPADTAFFLWLTDGALGIVTSLTVFPLTAAFLGMSESFGKDMSASRALWGAGGGLVSGVITGTIVAIGYLASPVFGTATPTGVIAIFVFASEMLIITGVTGFIGGASLWLAIESAERFSS